MIEDGRPRSVADFEAWHARQSDLWEFIGGRPCLMAPRSLRHTVIKGNVFIALDCAFAGTDCQVYISGAQILTEEISAFPDTVVSCAPIDLATPVVAEPTIIVEVMSPWSERDDTSASGSAIARSRASDTILWSLRIGGRHWSTAARAIYGVSASSAKARSSSTIPG